MLRRYLQPGGPDVMTNRERLLAAMRGDPVDHIPWAPRWDLWFDAALENDWLPDKWRNWTMFDIARDIGMGIKTFYAQILELRVRDVEVTERRRDRDVVTEIHTPHGTLRKVFTLTGDLAMYGVTGLETENYVKCREDFDAARFVVDHTDVIPTPEAYELEAAAIGEDGLALHELIFVPFHAFLREWAGYQEGYYHLYDFPTEVDQLLQALGAQRDEMRRVAIESPSPVVRLEGNLDSRLTPPPIFDRFFAPVMRQWSDAAHRAGKILMTHTDGDQTLLLSRIRDAGVDVAEALTPPPMTSDGIADAREVWGDRIAIWGGIASTLLSHWVPKAEFEAHMINLFYEAAPGHKFILGTGDNVPTDADFDRVLRITEMVREWGAFPIDPARLPPKPVAAEASA